MFFRLGQCVGRWWWAVILGWIAVAVWRCECVRAQWEAIAHDGNLAYLPAEMTSAQGERLLREAFPQNTAKSQVVVVVAHDDRPLAAEDLGVADRLAAKFRGPFAAELGFGKCGRTTCG